MIKEALLLTALIFPPVAAGIPAIIAVPVALSVAVPVDRAINTVTGGTAGKTISGDTARARIAGSEYAAFKCGTYILAAPYDHIYFTKEQLADFKNRGAKDHCDRWAMYEADLDAQPKGQRMTDWDGMNE